jgi:hypothetical protein
MLYAIYCDACLDRVITVIQQATCYHIEGVTMDHLGRIVPHSRIEVRPEAKEPPNADNQ